MTFVAGPSSRPRTVAAAVAGRRGVKRMCRNGGGGTASTSCAPV